MRWSTSPTPHASLSPEKPSMTCLRSFVVGSAACFLVAATSGSVSAQEVPKGSSDTQAQTQLDPHLKPATRRFESPERFVLEVRGGPYKVFTNSTTYGDFFQHDSGPNLGVQLDGIVYRMPKVFYVALGGNIGYLNYSGKAVARTTGMPTAEETTLALVPLAGTATIRLDLLPRRFGIPVIFGARIGWQWTHWDTNTGARDDAEGWAIGPVIAGQVALDLDTFEPGGARALDEEWGINHTFLFGEVFHFAPTSRSLQVGGTHWMVGLGFVF
jgi:hypothetical protein